MVVTSVIAGASGGALANVALSPLGGGAGLLQSYWYGAGLILGERMMYTFHWEKIKTRLDKGEDFMSVLESEMTPNITAIANFSLEVMKKTGDIYMKGGIDFMAKLIENLFKLLAGESIDEPPPDPCPEGFTRDANGICQPDTGTDVPLVTCPPGFRWSVSAQQCVPEDIVEPVPEPEPEPEPVTTAFVVSIYNESNPVASQAIARLSANGSTYLLASRRVTGGNFIELSRDHTLVQGLIIMDQFWPPSNYKNIQIGTTVFRVRTL